MTVKDLLSHENAEKILDEAWIFFQEKGYRGVSIDELCRRCGLTKPTLYYYFHDKEELFIQVLTHKLKGFHNIIEKQGKLTERLEHIATAILDSFLVDYGVLLRDRTHIKNPANLEQIRSSFHRELFGPLNDLMALGVKQGELKKQDAQFLTLVFMGMINNFIGRAGDFKQDKRQLALQIVKLFLQGAKKHE